VRNNDRVPAEYRSQPLGAASYAGLSFASLLVCIFIGGYLLSSSAAIISAATSARGYYVLLAVLGLASAAFLFGAMRSHAQLTGNNFGTAFEFGGPVVVAILVVLGSAPADAAWCGGGGATRTTRMQAAIDRTPSCISYSVQSYADLTQNQLYREAVRLAKAGDIDAALERIDACQCHNFRSQGLIREGRQRVFCYLRTQPG